MLKILLVLTFTLTGCFSPPTLPKAHDFQKSWTIPSTFDQTWSATVELFAERGWHIDTLEKDSGIIGTDWLTIGRQSVFADCGTPGLLYPLRREVKFNVFVLGVATGHSLTVNARFRELRMFNSQRTYHNCTSTGQLETEIYEQILAKVR